MSVPKKRRRYTNMINMKKNDKINDKNKKINKDVNKLNRCQSIKIVPLIREKKINL
mgnify:CR=1 FL=1